MSQTLDTRIDGDPAVIRAGAAWLRSELGPALTSFGDALLTQRMAAADAWEGQGGEALREQLATLATSADEAATYAASQADALDLLADALAKAQAEAGQACVAAAVTLYVNGPIVHSPGVGPSRPVTPSAEAPASVIDDYHDAVTAWNDHQQKVDVWNATVGAHHGACEAWDQALQVAVEGWQANLGNLTALALGFVDTIAVGFSVGAPYSRVHGQVAFHQMRMGELGRHVAALTNPDGSTRGSNKALNQMLNEIDDHNAKAKEAVKGRAETKASNKVRFAGKGLGAAGVVVGTVSDVRNGESVAQATTSNVGGFAAGVGGGMAAGALVGSVVPVAGTAVGAVVGAAVGIGIGIVTSGMIDSIWEKGTDDALGVLKDGGKELAGTVKDAGKLVGQGWNAVFG